MADGVIRVAVVGSGEIGRGWAALCAAHGWPVTLYDNESRALAEALDEVTARARSMVALGHADPAQAETGIGALAAGRSLLQATGEAEWVIESIREDLIAKQKMFEGLESTALKARVVTSSSTGLATSDIVARCRRRHRCLVAHPLNPPELIPLIELIPGPETDKALMEVLKGWLRALGKIPVTLKKPVKGNIANRIAAAVWREAIDLVLEGAIDVDDLDRAVSLGPGLGWAAAGPHLTYHLAAGDRGVSGFLQHLLQTFEELWTDLATWDKLDPQQQHKLISQIEKSYKENLDVIRKARDRRLGEMLRAMGGGRKDGGS